MEKNFPQCKLGRKRVEPSYILDELLHVLWTGCPWRSLKSEHSSFQTVHRHFMIWSKQEIFKKAYTTAFKLQNRPTRRNLRFQCIDSLFEKNIYGKRLQGKESDRSGAIRNQTISNSRSRWPDFIISFPPGKYERYEYCGKNSATQNYYF